MRKMPPLYALQCFEATAKIGTVRAASEQLCVSPSAVSHQIARLEGYLEKKLFHRQRRRLELTDVGYNYLKQIEVALQYIEDATWNAFERAPSEQLVISLPPSFGSLWLMPRLQQFFALHGMTNLKILDNLTMDDCLNEVDFGIEYRFEPAQDRDSVKLFDDEVTPLASPEFVRQNTLNSESDLEGQCLIITERCFNSWRALLRQQRWFNSCTFISVRYTYQALNAAACGLGIALGNRHNAEHFVASGRLTVPFALSDFGQQSPSYFLSCRDQSAMSPLTQQFYQWIKASAGCSDGESVIPGLR